MDIKDFYNLNTIYNRSMVRLNATGLPIKESNIGLNVGQRIILGIYDELPFPIIYRVWKGRKFGDIIDTTWGYIFIISDNFKNVLEKHSLTGWKSYPVKILDKSEKEIPGYHGFTITGRCGPVDFKKSQLIEKQLVPNAPKAQYLKGLFVGLDKWDGSDFFLPEGYFGTIISKKATNILRDSKLININLRNLIDIETPC